jgi:hypothetical protein
LFLPALIKGENMSELLDEDAQDSVAAMLNDAWAAEDSADTSMEAQSSSDSAGDVKGDAQGDGEAEAQAQGDSSPGANASESANEQPSKAQAGPPDMIPYARFRKENQKYREMHSKNRDLQQKLDAMQQQVSQAQAASPPREVEPDSFESIFGDAEPVAKEGPSPELQQLQQRLDAFEQQQRLGESEQMLEKSMATIKEQYPDVPDDVLYQAVIDHKSLDAMQVYADRYRSMVSHYKKLGADEAAASVKSEPQRAAAPRVPRSANEDLNVDTEQEMTMDSARENMERMLRKSGFFDS